MAWKVNGLFSRYVSLTNAAFFSHSRGVVVPPGEPIDDDVIADR